MSHAHAQQWGHPLRCVCSCWAGKVARIDMGDSTHTHAPPLQPPAARSPTTPSTEQHTRTIS